MKKDKFPKQCSAEQAKEIHKLFCKQYHDGVLHDMSDIFRYLPYEITYNGLRGDLSVTPYDIAYWSIDGIWEHKLVYCAPINEDEDVFDAFIKMGKFLKKNKLLK